MTAKKKFPYRSAMVACSGGCRSNSGTDSCRDGCMSCSACINVCHFNAVFYNEYGTAEVDESLCIACGACAKACPQNIISIHEAANYIVVKCSNKSKGAAARRQCAVSCIGCGICEKTCTASAVRVIENLAVIDEIYCLSCGMCAVRCPRHVIHDLRGILTDIR